MNAAVPPIPSSSVLFCSGSFCASTRGEGKASNVVVSCSFRIGVLDEWIDDVSQFACCGRCPDSQPAGTLVRHINCSCDSTYPHVSSLSLSHSSKDLFRALSSLREFGRFV